MGDFKKCGDLSDEGVGDDFEMGEGCIPLYRLWSSTERFIVWKLKACIDWNHLKFYSKKKMYFSFCSLLKNLWHTEKKKKEENEVLIIVVNIYKLTKLIVTNNDNYSNKEKVYLDVWLDGYFSFEQFQFFYVFIHMHSNLIV